MIAERLTSQLLAGEPAANPVAVVERLLAVQGQDPRGVRLAIRARSSGLTAADVDRALTQERSLLIGWLNRGTLHLVRSEDYHWLLALTAPGRLTSNSTRLAQEGLTPAAAERGIAVIEKALGEEGPLTRAQLGERIAAQRVRTEGQALVHLLFAASLRGLIVRGPVVGGDQAYVLVREWLGAPPPIDRDQALAELARRYLAGHGPTDERDLAYWAGLPLRDTRAGFAAIASEITRREDGLFELSGAAAPAPLPPPRLLGAFDPVLHGWRSREPIVGSACGVVTSNGIFRPIALVRGRAVATWGMPRGEVALSPFQPLSKKDTAALAREAEDVARYLTGEPGASSATE